MAYSPIYIYKGRFQFNYNVDSFKLLYIKDVVVRYIIQCKDKVQKGSTCGIYT